MVWGCMSAKGVGILHRVEGNLNSEGYINILKSTLVPSGRALAGSNEFIFQKDGAPCHTSKLSLSWLAENELNILPWAPQSPDMNPIEHLWNLINSRLANKRPSNLNELWELIKAEWYSIDEATCKKLVGNMNDRVKSVIKGKGNNTRF